MTDCPKYRRLRSVGKKRESNLFGQRTAVQCRGSAELSGTLVYYVCCSTGVPNLPRRFAQGYHEETAFVSKFNFELVLVLPTCYIFLHRTQPYPDPNLTLNLTQSRPWPDLSVHEVWLGINHNFGAPTLLNLSTWKKSGATAHSRGYLPGYNTSFAILWTRRPDPTRLYL